MEDNLYQKAGEWREFLLSYFLNQTKDNKDFLQEKVSFIINKKQELNDNEDFNQLDRNKQAVYNYVKEQFNKRPGNLLITDVHPALFLKAEEILMELPDVLVKQQNPYRFQVLKDDKLYLKFLKFFKILFYRISIIPFRFANIFRKTKKPLKYWKHQIHIKKQFKKHIIIGFYSEWIDLENQIQTEFLGSLSQIKNFEKFYHTSKQIQAPNIDDFFDVDFQKNIKNQINDWYNQATDSLEIDYELEGTLEYKSRKISDNTLQKEQNKASKKWEKRHHQWKNTAYALYEDWRSELEISALQAFIQASAAELLQNIISWQQKVDKSFLVEIDNFLVQSNAIFEFDKKGNKEELRKKITQVNYQTKKQLDQGLLQKLQETLSKNTILNQLDRLEHQINDRIDKLANQYVVTKSNLFNQPLSDNDLSLISNFELLSFEIEPRLNEELETVKSTIFQKMGELLILVGDIDEMISYMLSTANNALDSENKEVEAIKIISDGFDRAHNKSEDAKVLLDEIINQCNVDLNRLKQEIIKNLQDLKENENVSELRLRINKAKAFQKSEAFTQRIKFEAIKLFAVGKKHSLTAYHKIIEIKDELSKRFLASSTTVQPNREVSDFLNESNSIIDKLPIIYKRLYAIEPLNDVILFEGRGEEIKRLELAYKAWDAGKYASVLITGEKWSGLTSLINYGLKTLKLPYTPLRFAFKGNNPEPDALIQALAELLQNDELKDVETVIQYLSQGNKKVIILEDLQNIFLRVMYGQRTLNSLVEIITATQKNVFWITSMSVYTFSYLERSLKMSAFFSYHVPLLAMKPENISQLIIKRNRISGFKIEFEASEKDLHDKKFKKLNDSQRQLYLKDRFFKELNNFAKSNISMALMYWLLSTKKVSGHSIAIKNFQKPDLSFLSSLQSDRVFILQTLVMHDGLNEKQVAQVLSMDQQKIKFLLLEMLEDGILFYQDGIYMINPIVYRNTIMLLKGKNMLIA